MLSRGRGGGGNNHPRGQGPAPPNGRHHGGCIPKDWRGHRQRLLATQKAIMASSYGVAEEASAPWSAEAFEHADAFIQASTWEVRGRGMSPTIELLQQLVADASEATAVAGYVPKNCGCSCEGG